MSAPSPSASPETLVATPVARELTDAAPLESGARLGRYVVLYRVGRGGMGVVYAAYDPELDRKVAIKILRSGRGQGPKAKRNHARMLREAKILAKLSHPNVVGIHDVGSVDDRMFVAMDFVEGQTLRKWWQAKRRSIPEIIAVFVEAGHGLAAAHAADLVHRDFKPENVIVGDDGRVRVLDFGLARPGARTSQVPDGSRDESSAAKTRTESETLDDGEGDEPPIADDEDGAAEPGQPQPDALGQPLTRVGAVVGTPAYMAPEQHMGQITEANADQFAFCVSLYEALYREGPYRANARGSVRRAVTTGRIRDAPRGASVPGWIRRILLRGLRVDPKARWPNMEALLAALAANPAKTRWRIAIAAVGVATVGGAAWWAAGRQAPAVCTGADERLAGVWDDDVRAATQQRFEGTARPYAALAFERAATALDEYGTKWTAMHQQACEATHVHHEQSGELLDLRMGCLDDRRRDLDALTRLLQQADAEVVEGAVQAALALPSVAPCANADALRARTPVPDDPNTQQRIEALEAEVADAMALMHAGKFDAARTMGSRVARQAKLIEFPPLQAKAAYVLGWALDTTGRAAEAEPVLLEASIAAEASGDDRLAADARAMLVSVVGDRLRRPDEGQVWAALTHASLRRLGGDPAREAILESNLAMLIEHSSSPQEVLEHQRRALELAEGAALTPTQMASMYSRIATTLADLGQFDEALRRAEQARDIWVRLLGADHPRVAYAYSSIGLVYDFQGRYAEAMNWYEQGVSVIEASLGRDNVRTCEFLNNVAITAVRLGDAERGEALLRRMLAVYEAEYGRDHPDVAQAHQNLASTLNSVERHGAALEHARASLEIRQNLLPPEHPEIAGSLSTLANITEKLGRRPEAVALRERSLAITRKVFGDRHPDVVLGTSNLSYSYMRLGDVDRARELAERAVGISQGGTVKLDYVAYAEVVLARVLAEQGESPKRVDALVASAKAKLGDLPAREERMLLAEIEAKRRGK